MSSASTLVDGVGRLIFFFFFFSTRALASTQVDTDDLSSASTLEVDPNNMSSASTLVDAVGHLILFVFYFSSRVLGGR
jgi:hypothetical protein